MKRKESQVYKQALLDLSIMVGQDLLEVTPLSISDLRDFFSQS